MSHCILTQGVALGFHIPPFQGVKVFTVVRSDHQFHARNDSTLFAAGREVTTAWSARRANAWTGESPARAPHNLCPACPHEEYSRPQLSQNFESGSFSSPQVGHGLLLVNAAPHWPQNRAPASLSALHL